MLRGLNAKYAELRLLPKYFLFILIIFMRDIIDINMFSLYLCIATEDVGGNGLGSK